MTSVENAITWRLALSTPGSRPLFGLVLCPLQSACLPDHLSHTSVPFPSKSVMIRHVLFVTFVSFLAAIVQPSTAQAHRRSSLTAPPVHRRHHARAAAAAAGCVLQVRAVTDSAPPVLRRRRSCVATSPNSPLATGVSIVPNSTPDSTARLPVLLKYALLTRSAIRSPLLSRNPQTLHPTL
jgi:hypothetical protein